MWNFLDSTMHFNEQDGAALIRTMVSKEATFFRQQLCTVVADIIYLWMCEAFGQSTSITQYNSQVILASELNKKELSCLLD